MKCVISLYFQNNSSPRDQWTISIWKLYQWNYHYNDKVVLSLQWEYHTRKDGLYIETAPNNLRGISLTRDQREVFSEIIQMLTNTCNSCDPQLHSSPRSLTHWGRVTHICVGNLIIIGSDNGLLPGRRQAITWTIVGILLIGPLGTNFSEMLIEIHAFSFKKIHLKMLSEKWRPFCLSLNVLTIEEHALVKIENKQWYLRMHPSMAIEQTAICKQ